MNETTAHELIARKKQALVPCVYHFYRNPPVLTRGKGMYLYDEQDKAYLDCYAGVSVNALGHADPDIVQAVSDQVATLAHTTTIYLTRPMIEVAEALAEATPGALCRSFFGATGSEANETAAFLACKHTGRNRFVALKGGLHGNSKMTLSLTGIDFWRVDPTPVPGVTFAPVPNCFRCPLELKRESCGLACAAQLNRQLQGTDEKPAALILEIVQGNGGIVVPPDGYFDQIRETLEREGILLIVDEVQTGFGRTGKMFACEHFGLEPDILTFAKALGGGLPLGGAIATDTIADSFPGPRASTFGGNLVSMRAALTVLKAIRERGLVENAREQGAYLKDRLNELKDRYPVIGDVRGLGLMLGAELVNNDGSPASELTDDVLEGLKDRGVFIGKTGPGRNVLTFQPPLIIERSHIDQLVQALDETLESFA